MWKSWVKFKDDPFSGNYNREKQLLFLGWSPSAELLRLCCGSIDKMMQRSLGWSRFARRTTFQATVDTWWTKWIQPTLNKLVPCCSLCGGSVLLLQIKSTDAGFFHPSCRMFLTIVNICLLSGKVHLILNLYPSISSSVQSYRAMFTWRVFWPPALVSITSFFSYHTATVWF